MLAVFQSVCTYKQSSCFLNKNCPSCIFSCLVCVGAFTKIHHHLNHISRMRSTARHTPPLKIATMTDPALPASSNFPRPSSGRQSTWWRNRLQTYKPTYIYFRSFSLIVADKVKAAILNRFFNFDVNQNCCRHNFFPRSLVISLILL